MFDIADVKTRLNAQAEAVCRHLLPGGKKQGQEWRCGSINGEAGQSLGVHLSGQKSGTWSDFSTGEAGDLLALWQAVRGVDFAAALREAADYTGASQTAQPYTRPPSATATKPKPFTGTLTPLGGDALTYLTETRKIPLATLQPYGVAGGSVVVRFPYYQAGVVSGTKCLKAARPDGKKSMWTEGETHSLFGWPLVPADAKRLIITEGETDCLTLHGVGCEMPVVSLPFGAGTGAKHRWIEAEWDRLQAMTDIVLAFDADEAGVTTTLEVARRLGEHRCRVATVPGGYKDWNEALTGGIPAGEILQAIEKAATLDPAGLQRAGAFWDQVLEEFYPSSPEAAGASLPWQDFPLTIRPHELTVVSGMNGHGKSQWLGQSIVHLVAGGERACIFSGEMAPKDTLARMIRQATILPKPSPDYLQACMGWLDERLLIIDRLGTAKLDELLDLFTYAVKRYGARYLVVDSLLKCGLREDDLDGQKLAMEKLSDFKNLHPVHIFVVAHPRKQEDESKPPGKLDVRGSQALTDLADNVVTIWRNMPKFELEPDNHEKYDGLIHLRKDRKHGQLGKCKLWFDGPSSQFLAAYGQKTRRYFNWSALEQPAATE